MEELKNTAQKEPSEREIKNRKLSRRVAAEGMVLLKNDFNVLPLQKGRKIAVYGSGAVETVKGGIGSGDVNERETVSVVEGLINKGYRITNKSWLRKYQRIYQTAKERWRDDLLRCADTNALEDFFYTYVANPFKIPDTQGITEADMVRSETDIAIYVISRRAGEAADRYASEGDYYLTRQEENDVKNLNKGYEHVILIVNTGGIIDLSFIKKYSAIHGIIYMSQAGMEGGNALADIISGDSCPCGKLTDTWAWNYEDYPNSNTFSHNDGNTENEIYHEEIYVGYRYFDTFDVKPQYAFGYGLTYAKMDIVPDKNPINYKDDGTVCVRVAVKNQDLRLSGKEIVQVYLSYPKSRIEKEKKRLCGFAKSTLLKPGEEEHIEILISYRDMSFYDENRRAWMIEQGDYGVWIGNSSDHIELCGIIEVESDCCVERTKQICIVHEEYERLECEEKKDSFFTCFNQCVPAVKMTGLDQVIMQNQRAEKEKYKAHIESEDYQRARRCVEAMNENELSRMVVGEIQRAQGNQKSVLGNAGTLVPGSAGETSMVLRQKYGIASAVMADGPAGLRINRQYAVARETGEIIPDNPFAAFEGGYFVLDTKPKNSKIYNQYCTSFPVGTLLAQTWDIELVKEVGWAVGTEMLEFGVDWWLAPGMNIHRNPLCGRNFEYYSEDPYVSGCIAAAVVQGVQEHPGLGTVIKHFVCNNQEDNRNHSNSVVSERALREIYLKGFEIAVKKAQPAAIMTSFNLINGEHAANSYDLCTVVARNEWNFEGFIMTDWFATAESGGSLAWKCIAAGNDLIMPGTEEDILNIQEALKTRILTRECLEACALRICKSVIKCSK